MSGMEIERKFLVRKDRDYKGQAFASSRIKQGYIAAKGATVRVRLRDDKGYLTIKGPSMDGGLSRYEFEKEITVEEAAQLFKLCAPGVIDKTRYLVHSGKHTFELGSADEEFVKPDFIGLEVTGDSRFTNRSLRKIPFMLLRATVPPEYR